MALFQNSESNIDKLSLKDQLKLLFFKPDQFISLFSKQTKKPESTIEYSTDDIKEKTQNELSRLDKSQLEPLFDGQVSQLEQGAVEISKKIDTIKDKGVKENEEPTVEVGNIQVGQAPEQIADSKSTDSKDER